MARLVVQTPIDAAGDLHAGKKKPDTLENYLERVSRYFPAEFLGAFVVFNNLITPQTSVTAVLGVYLALLGLNILYMSKFAGNVRNKGKQIAISSVALLTWSYGIGGAVWDRIQSLAPQVELRGTLLTTMVPVLVSMSLAIYSPDGFVAFVGGQRVTKRMA